MKRLEELKSKVKGILEKNETKQLKEKVEVKVKTYHGYDYLLEKDTYAIESATVVSVERSKRGSVYLIDKFGQVVLPEEISEDDCRRIIENL